MASRKFTYCNQKYIANWARPIEFHQIDYHDNCSGSPCVLTIVWCIHHKTCHSKQQACPLFLLSRALKIKSVCKKTQQSNQTKFWFIQWSAIKNPYQALEMIMNLSRIYFFHGSFRWCHPLSLTQVVPLISVETRKMRLKYYPGCLLREKVIKDTKLWNGLSN